MNTVPFCSFRSTSRQRRLPCRALLVLLLSTALGTSAAAADSTGTGYALLFGVGAYDQWPALVNPVPDSHALAAVLSSLYGFHAEVVENPDKAEMLRKLREYAQLTYRPGDQLIIGFAGHGTYDEVTKLGYVVPRDAASRQRDPSFGSLVAFSELLSRVDGIPCDQILLVVDACFSGSLERGVGIPQAGSGRVRRFLASGGDGYVSDGAADQHTPFMRELLAGLRGNRAEMAFSRLVVRFMSRVEPRPQSGGFASDDPGHTFTLSRRQGDASAPVVTTASSPPAAAPAPAAVPSEPEPPLRRAPKALVQQLLERRLVSLDLRDGTHNPFGDFPNQFRMQEADGWPVVVDLASGLMWQQSGSSERLRRSEADAYVAELNRSRHGGHDDWRLPTVEELASLIEPNRQGVEQLFLPGHFDPEQESCWTADSERSSGEAYYVSFNSGSTILAYGAKQAFVRAVRSQ